MTKKTSKTESITYDDWRNLGMPITEKYVYVGRCSIWENTCDCYGCRKGKKKSQCLAKYAEHILLRARNEIDFEKRLLKLKNKILIECNKSFHGSLLADIVERYLGGNKKYRSRNKTRKVAK